MEYIALATGFILILIGLYGALTLHNIMRMIVSFTVAGTGINLVLVAVGYIHGRSAPIIDSSLPAAEAVERMIDPLPQALVLTAIVIGLGTTALMLAYAYKLYTLKGSLDIADCKELKW
jgi:multisubunit Na+/H+ antiporter MnhC subunit